MNKLKILSWNANGLKQHQQELQAVLDINNIDVCLIAETHFNKQTHINFHGYKVYHSIHPGNSARGGSAVIIKQSIQHFEEAKFETEEIQAMAVNVKCKNYFIVVASIYCPPKYSLKKHHYLDLFKKLGKKFVIGGDFNAKNTHWGSRLTTTKGRELFQATSEFGCEIISTGKPTYWPTDPNKIPDLIDFFIIKNISNNFIQIEDRQEMDSDHSPILLTVSENAIEKQSIPVLANKYTDWESFKVCLEEKIQLAVPLQYKEQLDAEVENYIKDIQLTVWENTPVIKQRVKENKYPAEILELIAIKRRARKKWHQTRAPQDKTRLNNLTQQLRRIIKEVKNKSINLYLKKLTNDKSTDYSLWKAAKNLKRPIAAIPPIRKLDGKWARDNKEKAKLFAEHLEKIFQVNTGEEDEDLNVEPIQEQEEIALTNPAEVKKEIKNNIKSKKAPGYDLITGQILKQLPEKAIVKITNLINAAFRLKYVPKLWKVAEVIMIPKAGKPPNEVSSYRPISLLPIMSKLFEKIYLRRLKPVIERKNLIPDHQFGFREKHATIDQVHRITNTIEKALEEKKVCSAVFLDVTQAFDKVWHKGLNCKLKTILPKEHSEMIESYLSERYFYIKQEGEYSDLKEIGAGVPQGSVLGPILYLLYTCDFPALENNIIATFADDTAVLAVGENNKESTETLQRAMTKIQNYTKKWRLKLNEAKSIHVDFTNKKIDHKPVYINGQEIPYSNTAKYLGMTLDAKLRWKAHIKNKKEELQIRYTKMYWLIGKHSTLTIQNKLLLYKQILKPVWSYGIQLWGCSKKSNRDIIQRFQNKVLRNIVNAPWFIRNYDLHRDMQIEFVDKEIQNFARSHEKRLQNHVNVEVVQLLDNTSIARRLKRVKPFELV